MLYCNLERAEDSLILSAPALSDEDALALFGKKLGLPADSTLTLDGDGPCDYLFQRRQQSMGWVRPTIPLYLKRGT